MSLSRVIFTPQSIPVKEIIIKISPLTQSFLISLVPTLKEHSLTHIDAKCEILVSYRNKTYVQGRLHIPSFHSFKYTVIQLTGSVFHKGSSQILFCVNGNVSASWSSHKRVFTTPHLHIFRVLCVSELDAKPDYGI